MTGSFGQLLQSALEEKAAREQAERDALAADYVRPVMQADDGQPDAPIEDVRVEAPLRQDGVSPGVAPTVGTLAETPRGRSEALSVLARATGQQPVMESPRRIEPEPAVQPYQAPRNLSSGEKGVAALMAFLAGPSAGGFRRESLRAMMDTPQSVINKDRQEYEMRNASIRAENARASDMGAAQAGHGSAGYNAMAQARLAEMARKSDPSNPLLPEYKKFYADRGVPPEILENATVADIESPAFMRLAAPYLQLGVEDDRRVKAQADRDRNRDMDYQYRLRGMQAGQDVELSTDAVKRARNTVSNLPVGFVPGNREVSDSEANDIRSATDFSGKAVSAVDAIDQLAAYLEKLTPASRARVLSAVSIGENMGMAIKGGAGLSEAEIEMITNAQASNTLLQSMARDERVLNTGVLNAIDKPYMLRMAPEVLSGTSPEIVRGRIAAFRKQVKDNTARSLQRVGARVDPENVDAIGMYGLTPDQFGYGGKRAGKSAPSSLDVSPKARASVKNKVVDIDPNIETLLQKSFRDKSGKSMRVVDVVSSENGLYQVKLENGKTLTVRRRSE